jgi:O-antigen/teichoic acid export membrane protein
VLIARVLNAHAVGLYNVAYNLATIPSTLLLGALQPTLLATGARLQDDPQRLARSWHVALSCVLVLAMPTAVVGALLASDLVHLLYGPAWADSAWVLGLLFLCLPAWASWGISTPVLWNTGRKHLESLLQLPVLALALPAWWMAAHGGIRVVAIVSAAALCVRSAVIIGAALRALEQRWMALAAPLARGLGLSVVSAAAVLAAQHLVAGVALPAVALAAGAAGALAVALVVLRAFPRLLGEETQQVVARVLPFVSAPWTAPVPAPVPRGLTR